MTTPYWSYWHAKRNADGSYGAWGYSSKGAGSYVPAQGDAEGWAFGNGAPPSGRPPVTPVATTAPPTTTIPPGPARPTS